jgi:hypothetical protein
MRREDIRDRLSDDLNAVLARLEALRSETDETQCSMKLEDLRQAWVTHVLAEEAVVYHALENPRADSEHSDSADERLIGHEVLQCLFERISQTLPRTTQWFSRLDVIASLIRRRIEDERAELFSALARDLDPDVLSIMSRDFGLVREKIAMLEQAKAR